MVSIEFSEVQDAFHFNRGEYTLMGQYVKIGEADEDMAYGFVSMMNDQHRYKKYPSKEVVKEMFDEFMKERRETA